MKPRTLRQSLRRAHLQMAALPLWAQRAADSSRVFSGGAPPERTCPSSCLCHELRKMVEDMHHKIEKFLEEHS